MVNEFWRGTGPRDQEAPRAGHLQRHTRPIGEADRLLDAALREPGPQLVGLDGLEQPLRPARRLRGRRKPFHHHDRPAQQRAVQRSATSVTGG